MTAFQRILINTERWNDTVVTPSLAKPLELICTPNSFQGDRFVLTKRANLYLVRVQVDCMSRRTCTSGNHLLVHKISRCKTIYTLFPLWYYMERIRSSVWLPETRERNLIQSNTHETTLRVSTGMVFKIVRDACALGGDAFNEIGVNTSHRRLQRRILQTIKFNFKKL